MQWSGKDGSGQVFVECAAWIERNLPSWRDPAIPLDVGSTLEELHLRTTVLASKATKGCCLPAVDALRMQVETQRLWNAAAIHSWPEERNQVKSYIRYVVAFLFLCSHCVFAPHEVCEAHMALHHDVAEKCILVCLKASNSLKRVNCNDGAQQILRWAVVVADACARVPGTEVQRYLMEIHFAQLDVDWRAGRYDSANTIAVMLATETLGSATYREALYEFIYNAATALLPKCCDAVSRGAIAEAAQTDTPTTSVMKAEQNAVEALVCLSLQLQRETELHSIKQKTFMGMTLLQQACCLLLSGDYERAVHIASDSYDLLHSFEPLAVRFRAEAMRGATEEMSALYEALSNDGEVEMADLCALAAFGIRQNPVVHDDFLRILRRRVEQNPREDDRFRLLCLLIYLSSEGSVAELLSFLTESSAPAKVFHRFLFCALWRLALSSADPPTPVTPSTRWRCLYVTQRCFRGAASEDEIQSLLLDMAHLALSQASDDEEAMDLRQQTLTLLNEVDFPKPTFRCAALVAQAKLAFLTGRREEGNQRLCALLASAPSDMAVQYSCELLTLLLQSARLEIAGEVAELCIRTFHSSQPASCRLEFAKVYAVGFLTKASGSVSCELGVFLENFVCPIVENASLDNTGAQWWGHFLSYVADVLMDFDPMRSVPLLHAGIQLLVSQRSLDTDSSAVPTVLLVNRLCALLDAEFDLFVAQQPSLDVAQVSKSMALLETLSSTVPGVSDADADADAEAALQRCGVTLYLTGVEVALRDKVLRPSATLEDITALDLKQLQTLVGVSAGDLHQVGIACNRVAQQLKPNLSAAMNKMALSVLLQAAHLQMRVVPITAAVRGAFLFILYDAFWVARDEEGRLSVFETLCPASALHNGPTDLRGLFHSISDGAAVVEQCETGPLETAVEFFAVEAWNESVQWNVLQRRELVERWRTIAITLAQLLGDTNASKTAIMDLSSQMPLL